MEQVLTCLPASAPGMVIVQHMPEKFTAAFAERLNGLSAIEVREARSGDRVQDGVALIAPGGLHLQLARSGAHYYVDVVDAPPVNRTDLLLMFYFVRRPSRQAPMPSGS